MTAARDELDQLCINTIRMLSVDMIEKARSGHPGLPLGAAPLAYLLWTRFLKHNPGNPAWPNRDRFILSAGHGSALLYSLLHLTGYDLSLEELKNFRQWESKTPGHPEYGLTPGVEVTSGPLGQGFATGVGMAMAERFQADRYNEPGFPIVDHYIYALVSDGDLMEGVASEAASLAGRLCLGRLVYLYDDNNISIEGDTDLTFTEEVGRRFEAYGWQVLTVADGNDLAALETAVAAAREEQARPSLIMARTHIGFGSPKQDNAGAHGEPLGPEAVKATREFFGWPDQDFYIPDEALGHFRQAVEEGRAREEEWQALFENYRGSHPDQAARFERELKGELGPGWADGLPSFDPADGGLATRAASGKVLNGLAAGVPNLIGGSADLAPSNKTMLTGCGDCSLGDKAARNIHFGVREHAMGAIVNGLALHGGPIPYGGTFLVFSDYMRPAIRLAALMEIRSIFIFTHDSIGVGEDGPTHQPIEHVMALRAIPGLTVIRPADANETAVAWTLALERSGPTALILTRQKLPILDPARYPVASGAAKGGYVLAESGPEPAVILIATGSEVSLAMEAMDELAKKGVTARVVSMPSWEIFEEQPESYRNEVLPPEIKARLAVEAGSTLGWWRYVGSGGAVIGVDRFGASAPAKVVFEQYGVTVDKAVEKALALLS